MQLVMIHETAEVSKDARVGDGTKIWHHSQIREGAEIGQNCTLSKNVYIDSDVSIGNNVKIQNNVSVYKGVMIEDDVFIGPSVTFTNDIAPRSFRWDKSMIQKTLVKKGASIGANATIICGLSIGEYAMVGAGSVVTKNVPDHSLVVGNPAKHAGYVCRCGKKMKKKELCEECR